VAGKGVSVVEVALLVGIEFDLAVVFETGRNAVVRLDGLDRGEVAIGDAERPIGCGELDAFADTELAVDISLSAATLNLVGERALMELKLAFGVFDQ
jgi:hypothetical protein